MATDCTDYDFSKIEPHWQKRWDEDKTFRAENFAGEKTFYALDMFPYPSGAGLHIGHPEGYTASDILGRYKLAKGFNVLHPMGWDAFGLPAEQHAIATGVHPAENTQNNIDNFRGQIKRLGFALDWDREVNTTDPGYFKWTQWIFLNLFKHGLAYVDEKPVWWCPALGTVLANEEVIDGKSERGDHPVERRALRQWVLRITAYADKLLAGLKDVDWPDSTKRMQTEWIGRSEGAQVDFQIAGTQDTLTVYTTRADTLFGATYMVVAPEHPIVEKLVNDTTREAVETYITAAKSKSEIERQASKEKTGVFTGSHAINPVNGKEIPIYVADYVLWGYGTGAIMAVPAHDERDFEFAQKFGIEIIEVIEPKQPSEETCYTGAGTMKNSGEYNDMDSVACKRIITEKLAAENQGKATVNYKLRDWLFSRQRYWGEPFPIVFVSQEDFAKLDAFADSPWREFLPEEPVTFEKDGTTWIALPLPSSHLPLKTPDVPSYQPSGDGESPLANATNWVNCWLNLATGETLPGNETPSGQDWVRGVRETNTMPQWAGSCWYYLRYLDPHNDERLVDLEVEKYWGMPDIYIGGAEHAVLHLLYARFWHQFLHDIGVVSNPEPFRKLFHQGIILGEDGQKMSKSRGNVVNPDDIIKDYGADALRLFEMFLGPLEAMKPWNTANIEGIARFLRKVWREIIQEDGVIHPKIQDDAHDDEATTRLLHETIKKVGEDIEELRFNTAIAQMMVMANRIQKVDTISKTAIKSFVQLLAPFAPHLGEELWARLGGEGCVAKAPFPTYDPAKLEQNEVKIMFQVMGKLRGEAMLPKDVSKEDAIAAAKANPKVAAHIEGKTIVKEIYVPGKIVNIVAK